VLIRHASVADAVALAALAERTFRETFAADNTTADMDAYAAISYSVEHQARELADPDIMTLVAEDETHTLIAYAHLRAGAAPPCVTGPSPVEVWRFYIDRPYHGRGLAQALMAAAVEQARARGAATLWLGVWERNTRAQAFYRRVGFADVGEQVFMLGSDRQTDRVMARPVDTIATTLDRRSLGDSGQSRR